MLMTMILSNKHNATTLRFTSTATERIRKRIDNITEYK